MRWFPKVELLETALLRMSFCDDGRSAPAPRGGDADVHNAFRAFGFRNVRYCSHRPVEKQWFS